MITNKISAVHIKKLFKGVTGTVTVLRDVDICFTSGHSYAITGISGSGKSTFLHIVAGFDTPTEGSVFVDDRPLDIFTQFEQEQYAQHDIGFLFQKPYLIKELSVVENIMLPGIIAGLSHDEARARAYELLAVVKLSAYSEVKPGVLSGGQQQRVCLARAVCNKPRFLFADEPTAGLDAGHRGDIIELMQYGMQAWGMGVVVATHDRVVADAMQQRFALHDGILTPEVAQ